MRYQRASFAWDHVHAKRGDAALVNGDCRKLLAAIPDDSIDLTITSPPYCMGKVYEPGYTVEDFIEAHAEILPEVLRVTRPGGSICWQVGYHVERNALMPLDYLVFDAMRKLDPPPVLRNRIIWTFGHGHHCPRRFSGRHETLLWFTKGDNYRFNLDSVRIPQKYPGKLANKGPRKGKLSGNPLGKNPEDVWDIPNVKANHIEKLDHPCQFPVALAQRLVRALSNPGDIVLDPYAGVASTGIAALLEKRRFIGAELDDSYSRIGAERLAQTVEGTVRVRDDKPIFVPDPNSSVARRPDHWPTAFSADGGGIAKREVSPA
jgi:adenine-specific DNA-methyltransferase